MDCYCVLHVTDDKKKAAAYRLREVRDDPRVHARAYLLEKDATTAYKVVQYATPVRGRLYACSCQAGLFHRDCKHVEALRTLGFFSPGKPPVTAVSTH